MKKGCRVISIILDNCNWKDKNFELCDDLAPPKDGIPICSNENHKTACQYVYNKIEEVVEYEEKISAIQNKKEFNDFLNCADIISYSNPNKETLFLDDIYVFSILEEFSKVDDTKQVKSSDYIKEIVMKEKVLICGDDQSGKTSLCKKLYKEYRKRNFLPIYLYDKECTYKGIIGNRIKDAFYKQYENIEYNIDLEDRFIIIIDQFQFANNKEKIIKGLRRYKKQVLIVDDIFSFNIKDANLISDYFQSILASYESFAKPLSQEITSQGYCYQALILFHFISVV